jgi:hypothetical protein
MLFFRVRFAGNVQKIKGNERGIALRKSDQDFTKLEAGIGGETSAILKKILGVSE